jgi:hypothetical protein
MPDSKTAMGQLERFLAEHNLPRPPAGSLEPGSHLRRDLGLNSLATLLLLVWIRNHVNARAFDQSGGVAGLVYVSDVLKLMDM